MSSIPHLKFSLNSKYFSVTYSLDNLGRITVAIAIPKIPREVVLIYRKVKPCWAPVSRREAKIVSIKIFN